MFARKCTLLACVLPMALLGSGLTASETATQPAKPKSNIQRFCDELQADADYTANALKTATDKKDIRRLKRHKGYIHREQIRFGCV